MKNKDKILKPDNFVMVENGPIKDSNGNIIGWIVPRKVIKE